MLADLIARTSLRISSSSGIFSYEKCPQQSKSSRSPLDGTWARPVVSEDGSHVQSSVEASGCIH